MPIQASFAQAKEHMPKGAGDIFITQKTDKNGNPLAIPVSKKVAISEFQPDISGKVEVFRGSNKFAVAAASGEVDAKLSVKALNLDPAIANALFFGEDVAQGSKLPLEQSFLLPDYYSANVKIANVKTFHLGKLLSFTSLTIAGSAGIAVSKTPITTKQFKVDGDQFTFAKVDINKTCAITWVSVGGATIISTFKIIKTAFSLSSFNSGNVVVKKAAATWTRDTYNSAGNTPATTHYQCSNSGVVVFNSADTGSITITHRVDNTNVSSVVAVLPNAAYRFICDPPGSINWVSTVSVILLTDSGTAMTGVLVGGELTNAVTPTTGQFDDSDVGVYTFAAADVGDTVQVRYLGDYYAYTFVVPDGGYFIKLEAMQNGQRQDMTRVAVTTPLSIAYNEYAVDNAGHIYISGVNAGETWRAWALCYDPSGSGFIVEGSQQGNGVELEITATVAGGGIRYTYTGITAHCLGFKPGATKTGAFPDATAFEFTLTAHDFIDDDGNVHQVLYEYYTSEDLAS